MFSNEDTPCCGACVNFEPARNEPAHDIKHGYCKLSEALERDKRGGVTGRLIDVATPCFMVTWHGKEQRPAYRHKPQPGIRP